MEDKTVDVLRERVREAETESAGDRAASTERRRQPAPAEHTPKDVADTEATDEDTAEEIASSELRARFRREIIADDAERS